MRQSSLLFLLVFMIFLPGCSNTSNSLSKTFSAAILGINNPTVSTEKIKSVPYATLLASENTSSPALLVLTWSEPRNIQHLEYQVRTQKWISANKELVVTEAGRIIKTVNLGHGNLSALKSTNPDPLVLGIQNPTTPKTWHYTLSWQPGYHNNYKATSKFTLLGTTQIDLPLKKNVTVLQVSEAVSIPKLQQSYTNYYWVAPKTGHVLKSQQYLAPRLPMITLTEAKPFVGEK